MVSKFQPPPPPLRRLDLSCYCFNLVAIEITNQNQLSVHKIFDSSDEESDFEGFSDVGFIDLGSEGDEENEQANYENDED